VQSTDHKQVKRTIAALLMIVSLAAHAQHHEFARERFHTPHWVFDDRFHHNHFYPALGYSVAVLPAGNVAVNFGGGRFWFHSGVWFQQGPRLCRGQAARRNRGSGLAARLHHGVGRGVPYYYANDAYYSAAPGGYVVANPPTEEAAAPTPAPQARRPRPQIGITAIRRSRTTHTSASARKAGARFRLRRPA
jgi:hypothetical protein